MCYCHPCGRRGQQKWNLYHHACIPFFINEILSLHLLLHLSSATVKFSGFALFEETCNFMSFSTILLSIQGAWRLLMKGCMQWFVVEKISTSGRNHTKVPLISRPVFNCAVLKQCLDKWLILIHSSLHFFLYFMSPPQGEEGHIVLPCLYVCKYVHHTS